MNLGLEGKQVVVTGGSEGIGYAIAREFLIEGARVVISARRKEKLEAAVKALGQEFGAERIRGFAADNSSPEENDRLGDFAASEQGRIDVWINNVGTNRIRSGEWYTEEEADYLIGANFKSALFGAQTAVKHMKAQGGSIVNIASLAARTSTCGRSTIYSSMKHAVVGLTRNLAGEFASLRIRTNAVLPGYTATPLTLGTFTGEALDKILKDNLLRRMADPSEIAKPTVFLASDAASYITGTTLEVSGGHQIVVNPEYSYT